MYIIFDAHIALFPLPLIVSHNPRRTLIKTIKKSTSMESFIAPEIHPALQDIEFNKGGFILFFCLAISDCSLILAFNKLCVL